MTVTPEFTGADALLGTAAAAGIGICFANPGTTEMPLVAALARQQAIRPVLCVFEGVCSGAADGYGRIAGKPAMTLTHLGPGFANAIANLHNARRGRSPVVNVVGEHATWHVPFDAPLTTDIVSLARPVSAYVGTIGSPADVSAKTRKAIAAARVPPGQVATLIFPMDCQQASAAPDRETSVHVPSAPMPDVARIAAVVARLRESRSPLLLLGGNSLTARGQRAAQRLVVRCDARLTSETFPSTSDRGGGLPSVPRLPYFPEPAIPCRCPALLRCRGGGPTASRHLPFRRLDRLCPACGSGRSARESGATRNRIGRRRGRAVHLAGPLVDRA